MIGTQKIVKQHLKNLERHLRNESPLLVDAVKGFKQLDREAYRLGLLDKNESYVTQIPWWPLISIVGTDTETKNNFLESYLGSSVTHSDNNSDNNDTEKFTVICYANGEQSRILPGIALDADARLPFYQMANEIEKTSATDRSSVNSCLQLLTCPSPLIQGYLFINAPSFDSTSVCETQITEHIINISDLVIVFVDDKQQENLPHREALEQMIASDDSQKQVNKFVIVANQSEAQSPELIERIQQIYIDRQYRILGNLHDRAREIEQYTIPKLSKLIRVWERGVLWRDTVAFGLLSGAGFITLMFAGMFEKTGEKAQWLQFWIQNSNENIWSSIASATVAFLLLLLTHSWMRRSSMKSVLNDLEYEPEGEAKESLKKALKKNSQFIHSIFRPDVVGWNRFSRKRIEAIIKNVDQSIATLNDQYARPSGDE